MNKKEKIDKLSEFLYEEVKNASNTPDNKEDNIHNIILRFSAISAVVAILPTWLIPGADFWAISSVQMLMGLKIAQEYGKKMDREQILHILKTLGLAFGMGFIAKSMVLSAYRTFVPVLGAVTTFPLVFSATYVIGKAFDYYFQHEDEDIEVIKAHIKSGFDQTKKEAQKLADEFDIKGLKDKAIKYWKDLEK